MTKIVPTVDLRDDGVGPSLDAALRSTGFVQLLGHGLGRSVADRLRTACDLFFACDDATKAAYVHPSPLANRGHRRKGAEALSYSLGAASPPDLFESFNCGADDRVDGSPLFEATPWPDASVPGFSEAAHAYLAEMERISRQLDDVLGEQIGWPLASTSTAGPDTMACIDYRPGPDGTEPVLDGQQRMGAHSDYTSFTLLLADPVPGLQIVGPSGEWIDVIPEPGALLMNVGDVLAMATNDLWPSTLHRVVPMARGAAANRRSVAYFHYPDPDVVVGPLDWSVEERGGERRYSSVTVAEHLTGKLAAPKTATPATGASTTAGRIDGGNGSA
jgi:isopenicillin N synthase-like dioxygenase